MPFLGHAYRVALAKEVDEATISVSEQYVVTLSVHLHATCSILPLYSCACRYLSVGVWCWEIAQVSLFTNI